ncbi:UDP-glucose 4-epimerase GalE [Streptomyces rubellomurinus]|uniref:UDP-glucose 4-epimerase n=1 Tax=Streptomyces rubellomurinus (strain ATCC 31215) TaxID=359131 RepID=A0A0F2T8G4_STRR3|nr:UDP-glucose 4-epimerase GalE [Streptomyces rubellomurinus]KJS58022.1 UDP-glucose 4-epimerase [Streptomyces rubellomurinus]
MKKFLIAGGAGFIGSSIASKLIDEGHQVVILDSLVTGRREFTSGRPFYEGDIADGALVDRIFEQHPDIDAVVNCAALIVVPDSVADPLGYYEANVAKGIQFISHLVRNHCTRLLFSSSGSIYKASDDFTVDENSPTDPLSPYSRTKEIFEQILRDIAAAGQLQVVSLRYFNPIGADPQLRSGLQIRQPTHALGAMIACHHADKPFHITGTDYPTRDGSGIRDYIHVWDLADAHLKALLDFDTVTRDAGGYQVINVGTGTGTTVRELVAAFETATGRHLDVVETDRRPGDAAGVYTRSTRAGDLLGWKPQHTIEDGIRDSLAWVAKRDTVIGTA